MGPLPVSKKGNKYLITAIDYATRWVIAKPVGVVNANVVANFLYDEILVNFGAPFELISDRGSEFLAKSLRAYEKLQGIRHLASSPYHPQTNGMVERMHAMVGHAMTTLCNSHPERWDEYLKQTLFSLRVRTHAVTKFSPFYLLYGVNPRLPGDLDPTSTSMIPLNEVEQMEARQEFHARTLDNLGIARGAAYIRSQAQATKQLEKNSMSVKDHYFKVGDWVKSINHAKTKFEFDWKGPFMIDQLGLPGTYWLISPNGDRSISTVNQRDLAPWLQSTQRNIRYFQDLMPDVSAEGSTA
jgi:hypothetical protein